jgi:hypothetical protein
MGSLGLTCDQVKINFLVGEWGCVWECGVGCVGCVGFNQ